MNLENNVCIYEYIWNLKTEELQLLYYVKYNTIDFQWQKNKNLPVQIHKNTLNQYSIIINQLKI